MQAPQSPHADSDITIAVHGNGSMAGRAGQVGERDTNCQLNVAPHDANVMTMDDESRQTARSAGSAEASSDLQVGDGAHPPDRTLAAGPHVRRPTQPADVTCELKPAAPAPAKPADAPPSEVTGVFSSPIVAAAPAPELERTKADMRRLDPPPLEGVVLPGYDILAELGRGGMGVVYKARDRKLQRLVALKMVLAGAHVGAAGLARFRAEAEAVAQVQHPNIVQIYETGEFEGRPYIALEFVDGGSLQQHIEKMPTAPRSAGELVELLAATMEVAHRRGIVHRDLKPANILLAPLSDGSGSGSRDKGRVSGSTLNFERGSRAAEFFPKIADFGLVKRVDEESGQTSGQTQTGTILGTPSYMAPEQATGQIRAIGPCVDIYALGTILYELLTGRPPFRASNPIDTIRQVIDQEPVPPRQLEPRVPLDLETICLKCLQKAPERRYPTAAELANDLRRFLNDEPIQARPISPLERAWKWGKRRPTLMALCGVSVLAVIAMVLLIVWHNVSLRGQLDQALAEERLARADSEGQKLLGDARLAVAARDWPGAKLHLNTALTAIGNEPGLETLHKSAEALLRQVESELRADAERQASRARFQRFGKWRDEAQFLGTLYTGMELAENGRATRAAVKNALVVYGIRPGDSAPPNLDAELTAAQQAEVRADCYQLFLILAETHAQAATSANPGTPGPKPPLNEAIAFLTQALRFGAPSPAYYLRRGRYLRLLGDDAAAAEADKAAAGVEARHLFDHFLMADEWYRRGDFERAIRGFDLVLDRQPGHFWAHYLSALCLLRQHRPAEARAHLGACLAQRADFVWLFLLRGFAQGELQAFDAADADYQKALQLPLDEYARYVLFVNRGVLRVRQERLGDAVSDLKNAIALKPKAYQAYANLAQAYIRQKQMDLALVQLDRAVELEPALAHVYRLRARLRLERREPALALADLDRAIARADRSDPMHADDLIERGRLLMRDRKHAEALASLDAALELRGQSGPAQRLRAEALFHLGRFADVVTAIDRYVETGKPLESVYRLRGLARVELGKHPGAIEDFTKAMELNPTSAVLAYRGWAHLACAAPKLAVRDFQLAIELDAANGDAYNGRGLVRLSLGKQSEAMRDADEAVRRGPASARLLYNAARIHAQGGTGSEARAMELLLQAISMLPVTERSGFWNKVMRNDAALNNLQRHPQFMRLQAELSQRH
jgi:serine/threonine protein kinase/Tfp pilus assembly protein PilF